MEANYDDPGICCGKKGGAIQVVAYNIQDFGRECRFHNLSGGVCMGAARLWAGRAVYGKTVLQWPGGGIC